MQTYWLLLTFLIPQFTTRCRRILSIPWICAQFTIWYCRWVCRLVLASPLDSCWYIGSIISCYDITDNKLEYMKVCVICLSLSVHLYLYPRDVIKVVEVLCCPSERPVCICVCVRVYACIQNYWCCVFLQQTQEIDESNASAHSNHHYNAISAVWQCDKIELWVFI